ncbi:hypothetical protein KGF54_002891 [Candida jiufengensis]|uniref:uncharacterized protein n=1 Tax=Candida jiufengensis TaxID=497108 RepID=UPI002224C5C0|nr:uncharacterized protein KGF54_002891 [Candida jiufengensis]KAI5953519.1 hypothetical protein KGF54_002891 [Candida jiufengensis]
MKVVPQFPLPPDPNYDYPINKELTISKRPSPNNRLSRNLITNYPHLSNSNQYKYEINSFSDTPNSKMTQEVLNSRLEVESTSTTSLPISYPYYYLEDYSPGNQILLQNHQSNKSADTFELLKSINIPNQNDISPTKKIQEQHYKKQISPSRYNDNLYNQVPKRFSQFIIDQQNPYVSQRLDNLDNLNEDDLSSIKTKDHTKTESSIQKSFSLTNSKTQKTSANQSQSNYLDDEYFNNAGTLSRNISNSMESQATIFSTRHKQPSRQQFQSQPRIRSKHQKPEKNPSQQQQHFQNRINNSLKKTRTLFNKKPKSRTSNVQMYHNDSTNTSIIESSIQSSSGLIRTNAIRVKKGSIWYRFKLKLLKFINKFKFYNFKASSKRSKGSFNKSKSLKRSTTKKREPLQNQDMKRLTSIKLLPPHKLNNINNETDFLKISNPSTNPNLGKTPIYHVSKMDNNLKNSMGITSNNKNLTPEENENLSKFNHLTNYINQQDKNFLKHKPNLINENPRIIEELPSPQIDNEEDQDQDDQDQDQVPTTQVEPSVAASMATTTSKPPLPPPHIDQSYLTKKRIKSTNFNKEKRMEQIWNSYLRQVLLKRIQLRLEIQNYQNFMITKETSEFINKIFEQVKLEQDKNIDLKSEISYQTSINSKNTFTNSFFENKRVHPNANSPSINSSSSIYSHKSTKSSTSTTSESSSLTSNSMTNEHGDVFIEPEQYQEEFKNFINRRSMLGEMLEYNSGEESSASEEEEEEIDHESSEIIHKPSVKSFVSVSPSIKSEYSKKKYGTLIKTPSKKPAKKLKQIVMTNVDNQNQNEHNEIMELTNSPNSLKRSFGLNHNLNRLSISN